MYENQNDCLANPDDKQIKHVWNKRATPIDKGWQSRRKSRLINKIIGTVKNKISENSLSKILILGIKDGRIFSSLMF